MNTDKKKALSAVLEECFWGDYKISIDQAFDKLQQADSHFEILLASRIITNSSFPSAYLRALFSPDKLRFLLENITASGRTKQRIELARAVIFHQQLEAEPSWIRT